MSVVCRSICSAGTTLNRSRRGHEPPIPVTACFHKQRTPATASRSRVVAEQLSGAARRVLSRSTRGAPGRPGRFHVACAQPDDDGQASNAGEPTNGAVPGLPEVEIVPESRDIGGSLRALNRLEEDLRDPLLALRSSTKDTASLQNNVEGLMGWKANLSRGLLPPDDVEWPEETFRDLLLDALKELDMARFTRKHPKVLNTLLKNVLEMLQQYELEFPDLDDDSDGRQDSQQQQQQQQQQPSPEGESGDGGQESEDGEQGEGEGRPGGAGSAEERVENMELSLQSGGGDAGDKEERPEESAEEAERRREKMKEMAEKLVEEFKEEWAPAAEKLEAAEKAIGDIDPLMEGKDGFDLGSGVWAESGWKQLDALRKKLEELKEIRDLVRELGRRSGKGPLRRTFAHAEQSRRPPGLVRSSKEPLETRGLARSGDISRMLPVEAMLLATDSKAMRLLHHARRAERTLLSYERSGWFEEPTRILKRTEIRPSPERGPIILCLDTSGSMQGARETVAKALTLECVRQAHAEERPCYLYAFSGARDIKELDLSITCEDSMRQLLQFLQNSFNGGTEVDEALWRSLARVQDSEWSDADILVVTDGEISPPGQDLLRSLDEAKEDLDLKLHGLLVDGDSYYSSDRKREVMDEICCKVHEFNAWDKVYSS